MGFTRDIYSDIVRDVTHSEIGIVLRRWKEKLIEKFVARRRAAVRWKALVRHQDEGQSMVELALCLPLMLLVVTGITTFGIAMNNYLLLTGATNSGARQIALGRGQVSDPCQQLSNTVSSGAPLLKSASLTYSLAITQSGGTTPTTYTGTSCTGAAANLTANATAKVTVTYPCSLKVYGKDLVPGCNLQAVNAELVQ